MANTSRVIKNCSHNNHNTWVCSLCYPFALELGYIREISGSLIYMKNHRMDTMAPREYDKGKFAILSGQGHRDDELLFFPSDPKISPECNYGYEPTDIKISMVHAEFITKALNKYRKLSKYKKLKNSSIQELLVTEVASLIKRWTKKYGPLKQFYEKFVQKREIYLKKRIKKSKQVAKQNSKVKPVPIPSPS